MHHTGLNHSSHYHGSRGVLHSAFMLRLAPIKLTHAFLLVILVKPKPHTHTPMRFINRGYPAVRLLAKNGQTFRGSVNKSMYLRQSYAASVCSNRTWCLLKTPAQFLTWKPCVARIASPSCRSDLLSQVLDDTLRQHGVERSGEGESPSGTCGCNTFFRSHEDNATITRGPAQKNCKEVVQD